MEKQFTIYIILLTLMLGFGILLRFKRKYSVKKMIKAASRNKDYYFQWFFEKEKPSYFGCSYDVGFSNRDNVQFMYKRYVFEGGESDEIVGIDCDGFQHYVIVYKNGRVITENPPSPNMTFEDCDEILALARSAFQHALRTRQAK